MIIIPEDVLRIAEALSAPIEELGLSVRSYNGLRRRGITTVADVYRAYQDKQLPRIRNLGEKSVIEIEKHLEEHLAKVAPASSSEFPNSSDCISRQAAIETVMECYDNDELFEVYEEKLRELPPAQLTPDKNGDLWITVPDIDKVTRIYVQESKSKFCRIFYEEQEQPERIRGRWIESDAQNILMKNFIEKGETWRVCDKCGAGFMIGYQHESDKIYHETFHNFCPKCGADMREVTE